jgi:hypothetical protein
MGTLTRRRFARNVQAFETALEDRLFLRHFNHNEFEVLVLTHSNRRHVTLRKVAGRLILHDPHGIYCLITFDALSRSAFATAEWRDLDGETCAGVFFDA